MFLSIVICLISFAALVAMLRRDRLSLGIPIAYVFALLLIHIPGAFAHLAGGDFLTDSRYTELGIRFTAIGTFFFVVGVSLSQNTLKTGILQGEAPSRYFCLFCLMAGWFVTYGLGFLRNIPSIGAAVDKGGAIWMLGVLLGLRDSVKSKDLKWSIIWLGALAVYPAVMLLMGGFLSFGSTVVIIVLSVLAVSTRSAVRTTVGIVIVAMFSFHIFLSYFQNRDEIREAVWGGAGMNERVHASMNILKDFEWFNPSNEEHLFAVDQRLNQNYFVGLAATRIQEREVDYLHGRSVWEGLLALVPRFFWPDKPVYGGSPKIIEEMTGFVVAENTSYGVGHVMEFQINFGHAGVIGGFLLLGFVMGWLDRRAAIAADMGDMGNACLFFLPAAAMIHPNGSVVELVGGAAAALVAGFGWRWAWAKFGAPRVVILSEPQHEQNRIIHASHLPPRS